MSETLSETENRRNDDLCFQPQGLNHNAHPFYDSLLDHFPYRSFSISGNLNKDVPSHDSPEGAGMYILSVSLCGRDLDWQVPSAAQLCRTLRTVFSSVEHLTTGTINHRGTLRPTVQSGVNFLGCFVNVKTLFVSRDRQATLSCFKT